MIPFVKFFLNIMPKGIRHYQVINGPILGFAMAVIALGAPTSGANDVLTPRIAGMGGAGRAAPTLTDAVFQNPSFFSLAQTYCISASFDKFSGTDPSFQGRHYSLSLLDGRTELLQAGLAYTVREDGRLLHLGLSKAPSQVVSIGASAKILLPNDASVGTLADTMVAVSYRPQGWFQGALIGENLMETPAMKAQGFNRTIIIGSKINLEGILTVFADPQWRPGVTDGTNFGIEIGSELALMSDLFLRFGYFKNGQVPYLNARGTGMGIGLGWAAPRISFDYAYHRTFDATAGAPSAFAHIFGTSVFF